jgi:hypothetical protein
MGLNTTKPIKSEDFLRLVEISKLRTQEKKASYGLDSGKFFGRMSTLEIGNI